GRMSNFELPMSNVQLGAELDIGHWSLIIANFRGHIAESLAPGDGALRFGIDSDDHGFAVGRRSSITRCDRVGEGDAGLADLLDCNRDLHFVATRDGSEVVHLIPYHIVGPVEVPRAVPETVA